MHNTAAWMGQTQLKQATQKQEFNRRYVYANKRNVRLFVNIRSRLKVMSRVGFLEVSPVSHPL